ncbi:unnamed protein product [Prorocentrum cordatum]|uniref:Uncharacterized protein n=1 Tax=Prorocentrum cordatum TaxID=2364126 RepID=A0ABN9S8Y9_9DINO|nr:unnamed protein product [Polarella glacialis]
MNIGLGRSYTEGPYTLETMKIASFPTNGKGDSSMLQRRTEAGSAKASRRERVEEEDETMTTRTTSGQAARPGKARKTRDTKRNDERGTSAERPQGTEEEAARQ